jgi:four helix bundle protein
MAKVERFEDLIAWQKARHLMNEVYKVSKVGQFAKDFRLAAQIQSAAISVMANIAEGFERGKRQEFHQFLSIAKGSCGEVRSHLYAAFDVGYLREDQFNTLRDLAIEVGKIVNGLRGSIEGWDT